MKQKAVCLNSKQSKIMTKVSRRTYEDQTFFYTKDIFRHVRKSVTFVHYIQSIPTKLLILRDDIEKVHLSKALTCTEEQQWSCDFFVLIWHMALLIIQTIIRRRFYKLMAWRDRWMDMGVTKLKELHTWSISSSHFSAYQLIYRSIAVFPAFLSAMHYSNPM